MKKVITNKIIEKTSKLLVIKGFRPNNENLVEVLVIVNYGSKFLIDITWIDGKPAKLTGHSVYRIQGSKKKFLMQSCHVINP